MKQGDIFNPKHIYCSYNAYKMFGDISATQIYVFMVSDMSFYNIEGYIYTTSIYYRYRNHISARVTIGVNKKAPFYVDCNNEIFRLTEDEMCNIIAENI
jgi:hypothetical protein